MKEWLYVSLMICGFGILKEIRPSEPFITKYLNHPPMNFSHSQIYTDIYPVGTYSSLGLLVPVFLFTDLLRYKPILIINGISGVAIYSMLVGCRHIYWIQLVEVLYGLFTACDVAYCTYIYSKVPRSVYQKVTSHTHGAYLLGRSISGILSQILISATDLSYYHLNFFTLACMALATIWACFLPSVCDSIYFHRNSNGNEKVKGSSDSTQSISSPVGFPVEQSQFKHTLSAEEMPPLMRRMHKYKIGFLFMWSDVKNSFTSPYVIKWAAWWALSTAGYLQVLNYFQILWEKVIEENPTYSNLSKNLNGAVEALYTLLSAVATFIMGVLIVNWNIWGERVLAVMSLLIAVILGFASQTGNIYVAYASDIATKIIYHAIITIANCEVAKNITSDSYALIFGITTFMALLIQSGITLVVNSTLSLPVRHQFVVYAGYYAVLGVCFVLISIYSYIFGESASDSKPNSSTSLKMS